MVLDRIQDLLSVGYMGSAFLYDTDSHSGAWRKIYVVANCQFTTLTDGLMSGTPTGVTFAAGVILTGNFTVIKLASGSVIAYK